MGALSSRINRTQQDRIEEQVAQWARKVELAALSGRWSSELRELDAKLDAYFAQQSDWDEEELAEMQQGVGRMQLAELDEEDEDWDDEVIDGVIEDEEQELHHALEVRVRRYCA